VLIFVGCGTSPRSAEVEELKQTTPSTPPIVARFDCDTLALTATFHSNDVVIEMPERTVAMTLPQVVSASGARYSDGASTFWNNGREATFELNGRKQTCRERREPWQEAADRGVDFRAVGQEPGWFLEIDNDKQIRLVYDYAEHELITPVPVRTTKGKSTFYDTTVRSKHLLIRIDEAPCTDVMSGEGFPRSVSVTIDARTLRGCGRDVASER
jgi:putative lipoprotein